MQVMGEAMIGCETSWKEVFRGDIPPNLEDLEKEHKS